MAPLRAMVLVAAAVTISPAPAETLPTCHFTCTEGTCVAQLPDGGVCPRGEVAGGESERVALDACKNDCTGAHVWTWPAGRCLVSCINVASGCGTERYGVITRSQHPDGGACFATADQEVVAAAIAYMGAWRSTPDEKARLERAERECGQLFAGHGRSLRLQATQCRLAGIDPSTVTAFNAQGAGDKHGWELSADPDGIPAGLGNAGMFGVLFKHPAFGKDAKQALILLQVDRMGPRRTLLLLEPDDTGRWVVLRYALVGIGEFR